MGYWELSDRHRRSFSGRMFRFGTVGDGLTMYSFSDDPNRPTKPDSDRYLKYDPMYWMAERDILDAVRNSSNSPSNVFECIRQGVALCEDWNSMNYLYILKLPRSVQLEAWYGFSKCQPRLSVNNKFCVSVDSILSGGWLQYIINFNAEILRFVSGPFHTGR